jgi:hypothetical protein
MASVSKDLHVYLCYSFTRKKSYHSGHKYLYNTYNVKVLDVKVKSTM